MSESYYTFLGKLKYQLYNDSEAMMPVMWNCLEMWLLWLIFKVLFIYKYIKIIFFYFLKIILRLAY
jgi:hypothetical protein